MPKLPPLLVVFDLDETLIASRPAPLPHRKPDFWWAGKAIYLRPHVHPLLVERFERGEAAVWTASDPGYALPILERILRGPLDPFRFVLTRQHCERGPDPEVPLKPLPTLIGRGADPSRTIVVDNRPGSFAGREANGLAIRDYLGEEADEELLSLRAQLRSFDDVSDVRLHGAPRIHGLRASKLDVGGIGLAAPFGWARKTAPLVGGGGLPPRDSTDDPPLRTATTECPRAAKPSL